MKLYRCYKCGNEIESISNSECFCSKCHRKMFKVERLKKSLEKSLIEGILRSIEEQEKEDEDGED